MLPDDRKRLHTHADIFPEAIGLGLAGANVILRIGTIVMLDNHTPYLRRHPALTCSE